jgi:AraC family transcriptional regulator, positive regulator of tynA and feaB
VKPGHGLGLGSATSATVSGCAEFRREMARHYAVGLSVSPTTSQPFRAQVEGYVGERLRFGSFRFTAHTTSWVHGRMRDSRMLATLQREGTAVVQQDGRKCRVERDHMFLVDTSRPFLIETGQIRTDAIFVDSAVLLGILPETGGMTARAIHTGEGAGAIFKSFLDEMFTRRDSLDEHAANEVAAAVPHLIAASLTSSLNRQWANPTTWRSQHRQRVVDCIHRRVRDGTLDAAAIAEEVELSVRYVYDLFAETEQSVMNYVWALRLERARAELACPTLRRRSIGEIAFNWGFNHLSHFSRAFRKRYGVSPREFRQERHAG